MHTLPEADLKHQEEERLLIQRAYRQLLHAIKVDLTQEQKSRIRAAYEMAVEAHREQRRKSGEPYILHPIAVAKIVAEEIGLGATSIICALLHDVVEDTEISLTEIRDRFGDRVAMIVDGLTKLDSTFETESPQAENFRKVLSTLVQDVRVVLIKMADRLHNLRTIGSMPRHKQLKIAAETTYIYAPLAHRLGLYNFKTEFQDLCMKITDPESYHEIARKLQESRRERNRYINEFIRPLKVEFDKTGIPYRIFGRPKSIFSVWNKIKTKKVPFEEVYDLFAVRIILEVERKQEKPACWQFYSIVTDVHTPIPERLKDWITTPKSNGYESLHTTVVGPKGRFVEVQIRSERMDAIAERGLAAHWKYKGVSAENSNDVFETWLDSVRESLENPSHDAVEFLNDFKTNLFNEEVYVYTPKGDMRILPKGATALDFAYSIHTDLGYRCTAVKVNNKLVPMGYKLQNGDQVSIITGKHQKPSEDWLKMVVTGKARSKIRTALKDERKQQAMLGKETLERKLDHWKVDFEDAVDTLTRHYGYKNRIDLYHDLSTGKLSIQDIRNFRVEGRKLVFEEEDKIQVKPETEDNNLPDKLGDGKPQLLVNGEPASQYSFSLATCCNPVMGDDVFAYMSNSGMKIHRTTCPNATHLMANYALRIMKAEWVQSSNSSFIALLQITGIDDGPGVIERLTQKISSSLGLNIRSFYIDGNQGYFEGKVSIVVKNKNQLDLAIRTLKSLPNISSVVRAEIS